MLPLHRLRASTASLTDTELLAAYAWPDDRRWVRAMMVTTLDGAAAGPDGLSGSLSSAGDQLVFNTVRRRADAVLVGAQTMRDERYTPMRAKPEDAADRAAADQLSAPVIVVVSGSLDLPWELPVWTESAHRPVVITETGADPQRLATANDYADVVQLPRATPAAIVDAVEARGLPRIVCEGGPRLLRDLTADGLVDEVDITIAPLLTGTGHTPSTSTLPVPARFELAHVVESDGFLMTRYVRGER